MDHYFLTLINGEGPLRTIQRPKANVMKRFRNLLSTSTCAATPRRTSKATGACTGAFPGLCSSTARQGLTLVHVSAQPGPFLTQTTP
jgi:hypothetical protein